MFSLLGTLFLLSTLYLKGEPMAHFLIYTIIRALSKGKHLTLDESGMIQALHEKKCSLRKIADALNCSPSTIYYEANRGTPNLNTLFYCNLLVDNRLQKVVQFALAIFINFSFTHTKELEK